MTFSSPSLKSFTFPVEGGQTLELAIAQFWSSGIGSHEVTFVDFEVFTFIRIFKIFFLLLLSFFCILYVLLPEIDGIRL